MDNTVLEKLYVTLDSKGKHIKFVPLAFTVSDNIAPVTVEGYELSWSPEGLNTFKKIREDLNNFQKNLPYASLRSFLGFELDTIMRLESRIGLSNYELNKNSPTPFAYLSQVDSNLIKQKIFHILEIWLTNHLRPFTIKEDVREELIDDLDELRQNRNLLVFKEFGSKILPWYWNKTTGTTKSNDKHSYRELVDYIARQIAGKEVFQGLGVMKRIISNNLTNEIAELMTEPIYLSEKKGKFSLLVKLQIVTFPSLPQPLLRIEVSKRRWLNSLKNPNFYSNNINGYIFSQDYPDRVFNYGLICQEDKPNNRKAKEKKNWIWKTEQDFDILCNKLNIPLKSFDGQQIALGKANTESCKVMLTLSESLQESEDKYDIKAGVPEIDKLEAFENITSILNDIGIIPFERYEVIEAYHSDKDDTASCMFHIHTLLSAILENQDTNSLDFTDNYLKELSNNSLKQKLQESFSIKLDNIYQGRKSLELPKNKKYHEQVQKLKETIQSNQLALRRVYPIEELQLYIFYDEKHQAEAKIFKAIADVILGFEVKKNIIKLPQNTHGARETLPEPNLKGKARSQKRLKAWQPIAEQLKQQNKRIFCLILAPIFYTDPTGKIKRDDKINKPSTRKALAEVGCLVQFLNPVKRIKKDNSLRPEDFFHRSQSSIKELFSAHLGRIEKVKEKVESYFQKITPENRPKEIIGITIVRKNSGRARGKIGITFLPIAVRINLETEKCELCCAYDKKGRLEITSWQGLPDALSIIARISPIKLASQEDESKIRFMEFIKTIISSSVKENKNPLVIIDSSNCVKLWGWLADIRMDPQNINLGTQYEYMQEEWKGARIIRIRQDLAPGIIEKKIRRLIESSLKDNRAKKDLEEIHATEELLTPTSPTQGLFKLLTSIQTGCITYLSIGKKLLQKESRGQSCYRETAINTLAKDIKTKAQLKNQVGIKLDKITNKAPFTNRWATPNPIEIVVTLRQPEDNPDDLAAFFEALRYDLGHYSEWSSLPVPLFFERVVRDYISEFAIEEESSDNENEST